MQKRRGHAHPTAPVLTTSSTDCGRGFTVYHRFTVWFNLIRAHPTAPVLTISSTDCGRGFTATHRFTVWFILIRAHPTAPVLTISSTDCGRGFTATHRFTVWFILHYRCCRNHGFRLGSVGFRGVVSKCRWLPSLSCGKVATCALVFKSGGKIPLTGVAPTFFKTRAHSAPKSGVCSGLPCAPF